MDESNLVIEDILQHSYNKSIDILRENFELIGKLSNILLENKSLSKKEFIEMTKDIFDFSGETNYDDDKINTTVEYHKLFNDKFKKL